MQRGFVLVAFIVTPLVGLAAVAGPRSPATIHLQSQHVRLPGPGALYVGKGADLLNQNCSLCHSPTFVDTQPALSAKAWQAEVLKMQKAFGAPIDSAVVPDLVKALVERHGQPGGSQILGNPDTSG
jgi:mono/diheme cytochrome c family protein